MSGLLVNVVTPDTYKGAQLLELPIKISVIIAVFNAETTLTQCLKSVFNQTYSNIELIVIDGKSTDTSAAIIEKYSDQISYFISEADHGIYDAWNKGLKQVSGEWVCFIGADDYFRDELVIEKIAKKLHSVGQNIDFAYSKIALIDQDNNDQLIIGESWESARRKIRSEMSVPHPGMMHRRTIFNRGLFDPTFRISGDYELFLREHKSSNVIFLDDLVAVSMRNTGISNQLDTALISLSEVRTAQKRHGVTFPSGHWVTKNIRIRVRIGMKAILGEKRSKALLRFIRNS